MENFFSNLKVMSLIFKWRFHLLIVIVIATVLSFVFTGTVFIKPLYKSEAILYPANLVPLSDESTTEQMLQIMLSRDIRDSVILRFQLAKHYEIDTANTFIENLLLKYNSNVSIKKTELESVHIEVLDTDPLVACGMVNAIIEFYNKKIQRMHKEKYSEVLNNFNLRLQKETDYVDSLKKKIAYLSVKYGLLDFKNQSRELTRAELRSFGGATNIDNVELKKLSKNLKEKGSEWLAASAILESEAEAYNTARNDYETAVRHYNECFTFAHIISEPFPAEKKAYPSRMLLMLGTDFTTLLLAIILIIIIENYKKMI
jgi:uncharacterized protein involved in exopolysaccharide biosynthesis